VKRLIAALAVGALLAACSTTSPDVVSREDAQVMSTVLDAVVLSTRPVTVAGSQSGLGAAAGAVVGGVAGSTIGGHNEQAIAATLGAVVGGIIGNTAEKTGTQEQAIEILVQLPSGERRAIVQARSSETFNTGDPVIIVNTGGRVRVTRSPAVMPAASQPHG
jgi:outer membrane lipoprotein SlyB